MKKSQSNKNDVDEVIVSLLRKLHSKFQELVPDLNIGIIDDRNDDASYGLYCSDFSFFFSDEYNHFFLTYRVGLSCQVVASYTKVFDLIIYYEEYSLLEDSYYDDSRNILVFGSEAIEIRQNKINDLTNKFKCPICDHTYSKKLFKDGYCVVCNENKDMLTWN